MPDMNTDPMQALHELDWIASKVWMIGGTAYKLTRSAIHAIRVIASVNAAKLKECRDAQEFTKQFGSHTGYMEIKTENEKVLRHFEQRLKDQNVEHTRLPNLQPGTGTTQYMFNLDMLDSLNAAIHTYEADRISALTGLKDKYGDSSKYQLEKQKLQEQMPDVQLITVDDYVRTAFKPDGTETEEFKIISESAKKAEHVNGSSVPVDDEALAFLMTELDRSEKIADGTLIPVDVPDIKYDKLIRSGKKTDVAVIPLKAENMTLVLPKNAILPDGMALIDKTKPYQLIQNSTKKLVRFPGKEVVDIVKKTVETIRKEAQVHETMAPAKLPNKTRRLSR